MRINDIKTRYQPRPDMCFQTALKIVYDELCRSFNQTPNLSMNKIGKWIKKDEESKYFPDDKGVRDLDYAISNLNQKFFKKNGYNLNMKVGAEVEMNLIGKILDDGNCSAPIVTIDGKYRPPNNKDYEIPQLENVFHELVVLDLTETKIIFYDTYAPFNRIDNGGLIMPNAEDTIPRFSTHWGGADREIVWIEKAEKVPAKNKRQKSL